VVFLIGLVGLITVKNIIMKIIALDIMNVGLVMLFVTASSPRGALPPIISEAAQPDRYADPVPQAVIITAIVIGFSILTLSTVLASMLAERKRKIDVDNMERMMQE